jgi:hypothetical protein
MPLSQNPPIINKVAADKNKAANAIHLQQQMKAGPAKSAESLGNVASAFTGGNIQADVAAQGAEGQRQVADVQAQNTMGQLDQAQQNQKAKEQLSRTLADQQSKLKGIGLELDESEFADAMSIQNMKNTQNFQNETQLNDLARLSFESDEDYMDALLQSQQLVDQQAADDAWELSVYTRMENDKEWSRKLEKDEALATKVRAAKARAAKKAADSKKKAGKMKKMVGVAKIGAGAAITYFSGGTAAGAGGSLMASGASDVATES